MTFEERIQAILKNNNGSIRASEARENGIPAACLSRFVSKHGLIRLAPGFYAEEAWPMDAYFVFQHRYPGFVFSLSSAIYLHGLGDVLPSYLEVTGPKNYRPMGEKHVDVFTHTDTKESTYRLGITEIRTTFGNPIRVYDVEKTICDVIRYEKKMDSEVFFKAIHAYMARRDKDIGKLVRYAEAMGIKNSKVLELILNR